LPSNGPTCHSTLGDGRRRRRTKGKEREKSRKRMMRWDGEKRRKEITGGRDELSKRRGE
jgi:hypothetical protein